MLPLTTVIHPTLSTWSLRLGLSAWRTRNHGGSGGGVGSGGGGGDGGGSGGSNGVGSGGNGVENVKGVWCVYEFASPHRNRDTAILQQDLSCLLHVLIAQ